MPRPKRLAPDERAALRDRVLVACLAILETGRSPSERQLRDRFPEHGVDLLVNLRDELRFAGRLDWAPDPDRSRCSREARRTRQIVPLRDAAGRVPWEQRVWMQCRIRAGKTERGEPIPLRAPLSLRAECRGACVYPRD
jgi:hypothetical protein